MDKYVMENGLLVDELLLVRGGGLPLVLSDVTVCYPPLPCCSSSSGVFDVDSVAKW